MRFASLLVSLLLGCSHVAPREGAHRTPGELAYARLQGTAADRAKYEAYGQRYAISTQGEHTTRAAQEVLAKGGNLIDAAIAASFVIGVERPHSTGLGGGGFMVFRLAQGDGKTHAVDFRERAPKRANHRMYLNEKNEVIPKLSTDGPLAVGVPGLVAGLAEIHARYGKTPWKNLLQPAIRLAEKGFPVYPALASAIEGRREVLAQHPASKAIFLRPNGQGLRAGDRLVQRDLGRTLREIAAHGREAFYSPKTALGRRILAGLKETRTILQAEDLHDYRVRWMEPIHGRYGKYRIESMPPPSSGGVHVLEILNTLENAGLRTLGFQTPETLHMEAAAMQLAFADRAKYLGEPTKEYPVPSAGLVSKRYGRAQLDRIDRREAVPAHAIEAGDPWPYESSETTHMSFIDVDGNAIATTQTINGHLGSAVVLPGTGIVLNNEMDDFAAKTDAMNLFGAVGGVANRIEPGKTPLSSMSPTLVFDGERPVLSVGAPGGTRIITCVAQTLLRVYEYSLPLYDAVAAVRIHNQWKPDELVVDEPGLPPDTMDHLAARGHKLRIAPAGCRVLAAAREDDGRVHAVADPREEGSAYAR